MIDGKALCIGLNEVAPEHYQGWTGRLMSAVADARDLAALAADCGLEVVTLIGPEAVREAVAYRIRRMTDAAEKGQTLLITFSGYGGQLPNAGDDIPERPTWCLFDTQILLDEIRCLLATARPGVRAVVISDTSHGGSVLKNLHYQMMPNTRLVGPSEGPLQYRVLPPEIVHRTYRSFKEEYDARLAGTPMPWACPIHAEGYWFSACQENQYAMETSFNGLFTRVFLDVWAEQRCVIVPPRLLRLAVRRMPPDQSPHLGVFGPAGVAEGV